MWDLAHRAHVAPAGNPLIPTPKSLASSFFQELKRRKVLRLAIVYAVVGFGVSEAADVMFPRLGVPDWAVTLVVALVVLGFPLALVLSWMFDMTAGGIERTGPAEGASAVAEPRSMTWA